jgi:hypothetical protein
MNSLDRKAPGSSGCRSISPRQQRDVALSLDMALLYQHQMGQAAAPQRLGDRAPQDVLGQAVAQQESILAPQRARGFCLRQPIALTACTPPRC